MIRLDQKDNQENKKRRGRQSILIVLLFQEIGQKFNLPEIIDCFL